MTHSCMYMWCLVTHINHPWHTLHLLAHCSCMNHEGCIQQRATTSVPHQWEAKTVLWMQPDRNIITPSNSLPFDKTEETTVCPDCMYYSTYTSYSRTSPYIYDNNSTKLQHSWGLRHHLWPCPVPLDLHANMDQETCFLWQKIPWSSHSHWSTERTNRRSSVLQSLPGGNDAEDHVEVPQPSWGEKSVWALLLCIHRYRNILCRMFLPSNKLYNWQHHHDRQ